MRLLVVCAPVTARTTAKLSNSLCYRLKLNVRFWLYFTSTGGVLQCSTISPEDPHLMAPSQEPQWQHSAAAESSRVWQSGSCMVEKSISELPITITISHHHKPRLLSVARSI